MSLQHVGATRALSCDLASDLHAPLSLPTFASVHRLMLRALRFRGAGFDQDVLGQTFQLNVEFLKFAVLATMCCLLRACLRINNVHVYTLS